MLRIVLDTSVVVTAFRSRTGAGRALLDLVASGRLIPLLTPALFLEYEAVLKRPDQLNVSGLHLDDIDRFLAGFVSAAEPVTIHYVWRPQLRDADDEIVFGAAVNGRADALVTYNVRDFRAAAPRFGLRIARPAEILKEVLR